MKKPILHLLLIGILITNYSCNKNKKGSFTTDKDTYKQGELITVNNTTVKEANFYKWNFGGTEIVGKNPTYTIPNTTPAGSFEIKLVPANSENTTDNWKSHSQFVTIVDAEEGKITFWKKSNGIYTSGNIQITISGLTKTITSGYSSSSSFSCGEIGNGNAVFTGLKKGTYQYTAKGSNINIGGSVTISSPFECVKELVE